MLKTLTDNNVLFYDEKNYNNFLYDVSQGGYCKDISDNDDNTSCSNEAYFICDIGVVLDNIEKWKQSVPNVKLSFKVNANFDQGLIRILKERGLRFSFSTSQEMADLLNLGIEPSTLTFNSLVKYTQHIADACGSDVNKLSLNTVHELDRVVRCHPNAELLLRVSAMSDRFVELVGRCIELGVKVRGLCYHFAGAVEEIDYAQCFQNLTSIVEYVTSVHQLQIDVINLGSKIPRYSEEKNSAFRRFVRGADLFTSRFPQLELIAEPTSFMFDTANKLCCNVKGIRHLYDKAADKMNMFYYLNDGCYGSLSNVFFRGYIPKVEILQKETFLTKDNGEKTATHHSTFWGPTCDSMDKICVVDEFPLLSLGDTVMFNDVGVYSLACATNFNGFNVPLSRFIVSYQMLEALSISKSTTTTTTTTTDNQQKVDSK